MTLNLPRPIAFVLGGGANLGAVQLGMLKALSDNDIWPDLIVGTSAGAMNGAIVASDPTEAIERLSEIWDSLDRNRIFPDNVARQARNIRTAGHLYSASGLQALFDDHFAISSIEELPVQYAAVATDIESGEAVIMDSGPLDTAILASSAIPGVFPLVKRQDRTLCDGGLVANLPLLQAHVLGAASMVLLECGTGPCKISDPPGFIETAFGAVAATLAQQARADLDVVSKHVPLLRLPGQPEKRISPFDFSQTDELVRNAHEATARYLDGAMEPDFEKRTTRGLPRIRLAETSSRLARRTGIT